MSISIDPAVRGISTDHPMPNPADLAGAVRNRLGRLAGGRTSEPLRDPVNLTGPGCLEHVDLATGRPRPGGAMAANGRRRWLAELLGGLGARLPLDRRTRGMFAVLMIIVAVIAAVVAWYSWPRPEPVPAAMAVSHNQDASSEPAAIKVSVVGEVAEPGLVEVDAGARVADAIAAAGGLTSENESAGYLNLARKVSDGELIMVDGSETEPADPGAEDPKDDDATDPEEPEEPSGGDDQPGATAPINLNQATADELTTLSGIGPVMAQRIVDYRDQNGGFDSVDQLSDVSGIGPATLDKISDQVTV